MKIGKNIKHYCNCVALRTTLIYIVLSALWILFSDRLLLNNPSTAIYISMAKGWFYTSVMGIIIYVALDREISKLSKANKKIRESELQFKAAFNLSPSLMCIARMSDGVILDINEEYTNLLGYSKEEAVGKKMPELPTWANTEDLKILIDKLQKSDQVIDFETKFKDKKGATIIVLYSAKNIDFQGDKCVLSVAHDITKIKLEEERLKEIDKLKDNFLSVTTHELKTPLIPIKSQTQLLLGGDYGPLNSEQKRAIEMIARNEESLNRLTSDLMDISKIKSNKLSLTLESVVIDEILSNTVKDLEHLAQEKNITITLEPITGLPLVMADRQKITQVLNNVVGNSIKFTQNNGKIFINLKSVDKEILITVRDNGIGISEANLKKLFMPFFQAQNDLDRKYRGTGLGLAIARGIIDAHGGRIWAESDGENKGMSLTFSLPLK